MPLSRHSADDVLIWAQALLDTHEIDGESGKCRCCHTFGCVRREYAVEVFERNWRHGLPKRKAGGAGAGAGAGAGVGSLQRIA